MKQNINN